MSKRKRNWITFLFGSYTCGCQPFLSSSWKMKLKSFHFPNPGRLSKSCSIRAQGISKVEYLVSERGNEVNKWLQIHRNGLQSNLSPVAESGIEEVDPACRGYEYISPESTEPRNATSNIHLHNGSACRSGVGRKCISLYQLHWVITVNEWGDHFHQWARNNN